MDSDQDVFRVLDGMHEPARLTVEDVAKLPPGSRVGSFSGLCQDYSRTVDGDQYNAVIDAALRRSSGGVRHGWVQLRNYSFIVIDRV